MTTKELLKWLLKIICELVQLYVILAGELPQLRFVHTGGNRGTGADFKTGVNPGVEVRSLTQDQGHVLSAQEKIIPFPALTTNNPGTNGADEAMPSQADTAALLARLLLNTQNNQPQGVIEDNSDNEKQKKGIHEFTKKELNRMPEKFKIIFNKKIATAHWRTRANGSLELRCRIDGKDYTGTGKDENTAINNFIECLNRQDEDKISKNISFADYSALWLENRKNNIAEKTYKFYFNYLKQTINPVFGKLRVNQIRQFDIQRLIDKYSNNGNLRTAKAIYTILCSVFSFAVIDQLIPVSPMGKIYSPRYEQKHGVPLKRVDEKTLIDALLSGNKVAQIFVFMLFTGIRRSEFNTAYIEGDWVCVNTSKLRKGASPKLRKVPITPMLKRYLPYIHLDELHDYAINTLSTLFKRLCPEHHLHELRHTFITRCQECGVRREIVSLWVGHVADSSITTVIYTHLEQNEELQQDEAKKVDYVIS